MIRRLARRAPGFVFDFCAACLCVGFGVLIGKYGIAAGKAIWEAFQ